MRKLAESGADAVSETRPERVTDLGDIAEFLAGEWPLLTDRLLENLEKEKV